MRFHASLLYYEAVQLVIQDEMLYSWSLNNTGLSCVGPVTHGFVFNKYTVIPLYLQISHLQIQPTVNPKRYFRSMVWSPQMWRLTVGCMHCSIPLYVGGLNVHGVWCLWVVLEQVPCRYHETPKFLGRSKLHVNSWLHRVSVSAPNLRVVQGLSILWKALDCRKPSCTQEESCQRTRWPPPTHCLLHTVSHCLGVENSPTKAEKPMATLLPLIIIFGMTSKKKNLWFFTVLSTWNLWSFI